MKTNKKFNSSFYKTINSSKESYLCDKIDCK